MIFGKFMAAVNYTNVVNRKFLPSDRVPTLVSGTGSRILRTQDFFPRIQAMFRRQDAANCVHLSKLSWCSERNNLLMLRFYYILNACDACHLFLYRLN